MKASYRKSSLLVLAAGLSLVPPLFAQRPRYTADQLIPPPAKKAAQVKITQGPVLELFRNNEAIIRWTSNNPGGSDEHFGLVRYGTDPKQLTQTARSHIRLNRSHPYTVFRVRMENLKPGITYYYTVASTSADGAQDAVKSGMYHFTAPHDPWVNPSPDKPAGAP